MRYGAAGGPTALAPRAGARRGAPAAPPLPTPPPPPTLFAVDGALALAAQAAAVASAAAQPAAGPAPEAGPGAGPDAAAPPVPTSAALAPTAQPLLVPGLPDYTAEERLRQELEILHLTASSHPLVLVRPRLAELGATPVADLPRLAGRRVKVAGLLATAKSAVVHKTGERMKFLTLEDETGLCEVTLFPRVYQRYGRLLLTRGPYLVTGRVEDDHGAISVTAEKVEVLRKQAL